MMSTHLDTKNVAFSELLLPWSSFPFQTITQRSVEVQVNLPQSGYPTDFSMPTASIESEEYNLRRKRQRQCQHMSGCQRYAQGNTKLCISHGGGRRCQAAGCTKSVQGAKSEHCIAHGGGRRCEVAGCSRSSRGNSNRCVHHGGGARCQEPDCRKSAQRPSDYCILHGGGKKCTIAGCDSMARSHHPHVCMSHARVMDSNFNEIHKLGSLPAPLQNIF